MSDQSRIFAVRSVHLPLGDDSPSPTTSEPLWPHLGEQERCALISLIEASFRYLSDNIETWAPHEISLTPGGRVQVTIEFEVGHIDTALAISAAGSATAEARLVADLRRMATRAPSGPPTD